MKLSIQSCTGLMLLSALFLPAQLSGASEVIAQSAVAYSAEPSALLDRPARVDLEGVPLVEALTTLRRQADVHIVFSPTLLPVGKRTSCECHEVTVGEALDRILEGTGFSYFEMPLQIVIQPPESSGSRMQSLPLRTTFAFSPEPIRRAAPRLGERLVTQAAIAGVVLNSTTLQPLAGALVVASETGRSTLSDPLGRFRLEGVSGQTVEIEIQLIGYATEELTVTVGDENVRVTLEPSAIALDAVVVSALGIERERRALGYSVATVAPEEMTVNARPNFMDALQGKMAGVNITPLGSGPQGSSKVRIRGQSSFGGANSPLIVVNGVPIDNTSFGVSGEYDERGSNRNSDSGDGLSSINPNNIVSMSVLKGAAAAALYGARAKDGVIIITTRNRGLGEGVQWELSSNFTTETPMDFRDYQMEYGQGEGGARPTVDDPQEGSGQWSFGEKFEPGMTAFLFGQEVPYEPQPNQLQEYYRTGYNFSNTLRVSHGSENGGVSASLGRLNSQAILETSDYERTTVNVGFTQQVAERYNISGNVNYSHEDRDNPPNIAEQDYSPVVIYNMATSMPMSLLEENAFDENGDEVFWSRFTNRTNPYFALSRFEDNVRDRIFGNITGRVDITSWLYGQARLGQDYYNRSQEYNLPTGSTRQAPAPPGYVNGQYVQDQFTFRELNVDFLLGGDAELGVFGFSGFVGGNQMRRRSERASTLAQDFFARGTYNLNNGRLVSPEYSLNERQVNSLYGSAEVAYNELLFLTGTLRNDWFSTLSPENRSILYPSVAASLVFTDAIQAPSWLTFGKIRAAYAEVGSDTDVPPYAHNLFYSIDSNFFHNEPLATISGTTLPNPNLRPMRLSEWEIGLETRLFDNINFEGAFYQRTSEDQILNQQVSTASGFSSRRINVGKSQNRGVEMLVDFWPVRSDAFDWNTTFSGSYNQSEVLDLGTDVGVDQITVGGADFHGELRQVIGEPLNQLYGWGWLRDDQGRQVFSPTDGLPLRSEEQLSFGSALPVWTGGITNTLTSGNLTLNFLIDFKLGHKLISGTHTNAYRHGLDKATLPGREEGCVVGDGVLPDGSPNTICAPVQSFYESVRTLRISEASVFNAGSWQLRQISLGYDLTDRLPQNIGITGMTVNLVANNVAVLKKWVPHLHPDQNGIYSDARMGLEATGLPVTRGIGLDVNVRF